MIDSNFQPQAEILYCSKDEHIIGHHIRLELSHLLPYGYLPSASHAMLMHYLAASLSIRSHNCQDGNKTPPTEPTDRFLCL